MNVDWTLAGAVVLSGLVIVFLILIILIFAVELVSRLVTGAEKATRHAAPSETKPLIPAPMPAQNPVSVAQDIEEETAAVISAAVYSYINETAPGAAYAIKSITRSTGKRPVWGFAGMQQNTRPF